MGRAGDPLRTSETSSAPGTRGRGREESGLRVHGNRPCSPDAAAMASAEISVQTRLAAVLSRTRDPPREAAREGTRGQPPQDPARTRPPRRVSPSERKSSCQAAPQPCSWAQARPLGTGNTVTVCGTQS